MTHRWQAVADALRSRIAAGHHGRDGALPTEAALGDEFGVSRITVRRALDALRDEGLLEAGRGRGWRVAGVSSGRPVGFFAVTDADHGRSVDVDYAIVAWSSGPVTGGPLGIEDDGRPLLRVERLGTVAGRPVDRSVVHIGPDFAPSISPAQIDAVPPARLLASLGCELGAADQQVRATLAGEDDASLDLSSGDPLLVVERLVRDAAGVAVLHTEHRHPGALVQVDLRFPTTDTSGRPPVRFVRLR